jgi:hypothetical protein
LDLVVGAYEVEVEGGVDWLEKESGVESDAAFVEVGSEFADACAAVQMGFAPAGGDGIDGGADFLSFGSGELAKLREEIGVDLNRQGGLRGRR